jgi:tetrathionate reductase subunit B
VVKLVESSFLKLQEELPHLLNRRIERKSDKPRWAMVIDLTRCVGCYSCQVSCKMENGVPYEYFRTHVEIIERGTYPNVRRIFLPRLCNHCDNPSCVPVCPVGATYKREDGIVVVDYDRCIGCGYCVQACPYGARYPNPETGTVDKCDYCLHKLEDGEVPACVANCMGGARIFGDLNDPESPVSLILASKSVATLKPETGNQPRVYYIGLEEAVRIGLGETLVVNPKIGGVVKI